MQFVDRHDAGRRLAAELVGFAGERPVVVALPRGGVPIAFEVAHALGAPLEILAVRKLGAPGNPELAVGAVAEDGTGVFDPRSAGMLGMTQEMFDSTLEQESQELRRRVERYRDGRAPIPVSGRTVIVVDDGLATGLTDLAAVRALRKRGARRIVVAVPVGSGEAVSLLAEEADRVVCLTVPRLLRGVGMWYRDFAPVSDEQVLALLAEATGEHDASPAPVEVSSPGPSTPRAEGPGSVELSFDLGGVRLAGDLTTPAAADGLVLFAHGSGSSRMSPRNRAVARTLNDAGLATLLFDLLDEHEAVAPRARVRRSAARHPPGDGHATGQDRSRACARCRSDTSAPRPERRRRCGRPPKSGTGWGRSSPAAAVPTWPATELSSVVSPTLLIVGSRDRQVLELNRSAAARLQCPHDLVVVDGAGAPLRGARGA